MTASRYTIEAVSFSPAGVTIAYMGPTDVRVEGAVYQAHSIGISWDSPEELQAFVTAVEDAAGELLSQAIQAWARSKPHDVVEQRQQDMEEQDRDDDEGLGYS